MENEITITNDEALAMAEAMSEFLLELMAFEGWENIGIYDLRLINRVLNPIGWKCDCYGDITAVEKEERR